jgi:hypothetical protein
MESAPQVAEDMAWMLCGLDILGDLPKESCEDVPTQNFGLPALFDWIDFLKAESIAIRGSNWLEWIGPVRASNAKFRYENIHS